MERNRDEKADARFLRLLPKQIYNSIRYYESAVVLEGKKQKKKHLWIIVTEDALYIIELDAKKVPQPLELTQVKEIVLPGDTPDFLVPEMAARSQHIIVRGTEYLGTNIPSSLDVYSWVEHTGITFHVLRAVICSQTRALRGKMFNRDSAQYVKNQKASQAGNMSHRDTARMQTVEEAAAQQDAKDRESARLSARSNMSLAPSRSSPRFDVGGGGGSSAATAAGGGVRQATLAPPQPGHTRTASHDVSKPATRKPSHLQVFKDQAIHKRSVSADARHREILKYEQYLKPSLPAHARGGYDARQFNNPRHGTGGHAQAPPATSKPPDKKPTRVLFKEMEDQILAAETMEARAELLDELRIAVEANYLLKELLFESESIWRFLFDEIQHYCVPFPYAVRTEDEIQAGYSRPDELDYLQVVYDLIYNCMFGSEPINSRLLLLTRPPPYGLTDLLKLITTGFEHDLESDSGGHETGRLPGNVTVGSRDNSPINQKTANPLSNYVSMRRRGEKHRGGISANDLEDDANRVRPLEAHELEALVEKDLQMSILEGIEITPRTRNTLSDAVMTAGVVENAGAKFLRNTRKAIARAEGGKGAKAPVTPMVRRLTLQVNTAAEKKLQERQAKLHKEIVRRVRRLQRSILAIIYESQSILEHGHLNLMREPGYLIQDLATLPVWRERLFGEMVTALIDLLRHRKWEERTIRIHQIVSVMAWFAKRHELFKVALIESCYEEFRFLLSDPDLQNRLDTTKDYLSFHSIEQIRNLLVHFPALNKGVAAEKWALGTAPLSPIHGY